MCLTLSLLSHQRRGALKKGKKFVICTKTSLIDPITIPWASQRLAPFGHAAVTEAALRQFLARSNGASALSISPFLALPSNEIYQPRQYNARHQAPGYRTDCAAFVALLGLISGEVGAWGKMRVMCGLCEYVRVKRALVRVKRGPCAGMCGYVRVACGYVRDMCALVRVLVRVCYESCVRSCATLCVSFGESFLTLFTFCKRMWGLFVWTCTVCLHISNMYVILDKLST